MQILIGALLASLIALLAWRLGSLSNSGAWAAALTGALIFGLGGLGWALLLLTFFISSSLLSRLFAARKRGVEEKFSKGARRDWSQVLANGGTGVLLVVLHTLLPGQDGWWLAYIGAMAAVNADTWATELGVLSPAPPRLVTTGRPVEPGTSGAVSLAGTLAGAAGGALVGAVAVFFTPGIPAWQVIALSAAAGLLGSLVDSLLGATVQAIYYCPACDKETERHPAHTCGAGTIYRRGWSRMDNDLVNWLCSLAGAISALGLALLIR
jgi:uncharacterized protein (TIGR00297 family)